MKDIDFRFANEIDNLFDTYANLVLEQENLRFTLDRESDIEYIQAVIEEAIDNHYIISAFVIDFFKLNPDFLKRIRKETIISKYPLNNTQNITKEVEQMRQKILGDKYDINYRKDEKFISNERNKEFDYILGKFCESGELDALEINIFETLENETGEEITKMMEYNQQDFFIRSMRRAYVAHGAKIFDNIENLDAENNSDLEKFMIRINKLGGRNGYQIIKEK